MKCKLVTNAFLCVLGSVAEWSKALVQGTSPFGGAGSSATAAKFNFSLCTHAQTFMGTDYQLKCSYRQKVFFGFGISVTSKNVFKPRDQKK